MKFLYLNITTNLYRNPVKYVGNIAIRPIDWQKDLFVDQYLIGDELGISLQQIQVHKLTLVDQIDYPDGTPAYRIVRTNPKFAEEQQEYLIVKIINNTTSL